MLSAAVYARISADTEGKSLGVQRQLEDCRKLAAARGWPVGREYVDNDISAYNGKPRPGYEQMVADLAAGVRDAVIVYNLDRLHRRPAELEEFVGLCERVGVRQVATVTADIDLGNDDGLFMARIFAAFAAKESGRKSARMKRKYEQNAQQGLPHGPARAFGYEPDKITIREREAAVVRELVGRVIAGESVRALTVWLNDSGVPTVRGARWSTNAVRRIVSSARIAGLREHRGQIIGAAVWDPIITVAEREQVLAALASRSWTRTRAPRTYVLSGLLRCGRCGARLFSQARHHAGRTCRRYVCASGPDHGGCGRITVVAEPVEELLVDAVLARLDSPALADALAGKAAWRCHRDRPFGGAGRRSAPVGGTGRAVCPRRHHRAGMDHRPRPDPGPHHRHRTPTGCGHRHHRARRAGRARCCAAPALGQPHPRSPTRHRPRRARLRRHRAGHPRCAHPRQQ